MISFPVASKTTTNLCIKKKKKQTLRYRGQVSGYQWGAGRVEGQQGGGELRDSHY